MEVQIQEILSSVHFHVQRKQNVYKYTCMVYRHIYVHIYATQSEIVVKKFGVHCYFINVSRCNFKYIYML